MLSIPPGSRSELKLVSSFRGTGPQDGCRLGWRLSADSYQL